MIEQLRLLIDEGEWPEAQLDLPNEITPCGEFVGGVHKMEPLQHWPSYFRGHHGELLFIWDFVVNKEMVNLEKATQDVVSNK